MNGDLESMRLVIWREFHEALRRKAVWITAFVALAGATALMVIPELIGSNNDRTVAIVGQPSPTLTHALVSAGRVSGLEVYETGYPDAAAARSAVDHGDVDIAIVVGESPTIITKDTESRMVPVVRQALTVDATTARLRDAGLGPTQVEQVLSPVDVRLDVIRADRGGQVASATVVSLGVYLLIFMITAAVANAVAIEKANRVSEVLLAITSPRSLLFGKVIGIGVVGLLPFVCGAIPIVIKMVAGGSLPAGTGSAVAGGAAWFVLGAALYLMLAAALGALVERQEEVGGAMSSLSILLVSSYIIGQSAADSGLGSTLAYIPFSAPMVEPARLALGVSSAGEVAGSLTASIAAVAVAGRLASLLYRRAIVRTGARLHVRDVLRMRTA